MATMFSGSLRPDCSTAANFQEWAGWIESVITGPGGWTVTSDTGQTPPSSLTSPTAQLQKVGYRIYKMHDDFTDDHPIYMRVDYGSGFNNPPNCYAGIWFSFGTGTNGAGTLTDVLWNGLGFNPNAPTLSCNGSSGNASFVTHNYASADNSRFVLGLFIESSAIYTLCFSLERTRDSTGAYTADGLVVHYTDTQLIGGGGIAETLCASRYMICSGGTGQPSLERGLSFIYPTHTPSITYGGPVPCAMVWSFKGFIQHPGTNILLTGRGNMSSEGQLTTEMYGESHLYQHLGTLGASKAWSDSQSSPTNDSGMAVLIRYD